MLLTDAQLENYNRDGFLVLKNFITKDICELLMQRAEQLINSFNPSEIKSIFSSINPEHTHNSYFLDSGYSIRYFLEKDALDSEGNLLQEKKHSINKIGHALHEIDPIFNNFSRTHKIANLSAQLGIDKAKLIQSMYICKPPRVGGEVTCHQDATYLYTNKEPVVGLWFALQDATLENGCLWAIPGGHREPLKSRTIRKGYALETEVYDTSPWDLSKMQPLEVPQGSLIVLHGLVPHMSKENTSTFSRHAYTLHVMSKNAEFAQDNWLQLPPNVSFKGFLE